jgi:uncharacterized protein YndB with AHSA1/START domain
MTTTAKHETEIIVDADVPIVRLIREFDAPPAAVYEAHVDPDLAARWMGPNRYTNEIDHWDARTGGSWRYRCVAPDGGAHEFFGSFHELRPAALIVQTFCYEGDLDGVALERLVFEDLGGGRTRLVTTSLVDSFEGRDAFVAGGMEVGINEGYEALDALLAG